MKVEQRIGRIDRLGQRFPVIRVVNLYYANTVEADVYAALRQRIGLFESVVGRLQPILARLPTLITERVLEGRGKTADERQAIVNDIESEAVRARQSGFDIDAVTDADLAEPPRMTPPLTIGDLDRVIASTTLLPAGLQATPMGPREYRFQQPGLAQPIRVSTDPVQYEQNADTVEFWSPCNPTCPPPMSEAPELPEAARLSQLLGRDARTSAGQSRHCALPDDRPPRPQPSITPEAGRLAYRCRPGRRVEHKFPVGGDALGIALSDGEAGPASAQPPSRRYHPVRLPGRRSRARCGRTSADYPCSHPTRGRRHPPRDPGGAGDAARQEAVAGCTAPRACSAAWCIGGAHDRQLIIAHRAEIPSNCGPEHSTGIRSQAWLSRPRRGASCGSIPMPSRRFV